jgi:predicted XRE-type DNA-binding protein
MAMTQALSHRGEENGRAVLTEEQVLLISQLLDDGKYSQMTLAKLFGVSQSNIRDIKFRRIWSHLWKEARE